MQPETTPHPKHAVQATTSERLQRETSQNKRIFINSQLQVYRKRNSQLNATLHQNNKPALCLQQRNMYIQRKYTKTIAINKTRIRLISKYESQSKKLQEQIFRKQ